jgi:mitochondrial cardiolipin hydrolase
MTQTGSIPERGGSRNWGITLLAAIVLVLDFIPGIQPAKATAQVEVFFSPEGEISSALLAEIESSRDTIDAAVHEITSAEIAQSLARAKQRGVKIRVITDGRGARMKSSRITYLVTQGVSVKVLKGSDKGVMNHRFAVFDGKKVLTGSFDWSEGSQKLNHENIIISSSEEAAASFRNEFDRLWREKRIIK